MVQCETALARFQHPEHNRAQLEVSNVGLQGAANPDDSCDEAHKNDETRSQLREPRESPAGGPQQDACREEPADGHSCNRSSDCLHNT